MTTKFYDRNAPDDASPGAALRPKGARSRYIRLFPERVLLLRSQLTPQELGAYCGFLVGYVIHGGPLDDDARRLGSATGLSARRWAELRAKLIELGVVRAEAGRLIDPDQQRNLDIQEKVSERQRAVALARWGSR